MTTIAYKDGVVAYDSRIVRDGLIVDDEFNKMAVTPDNIFFLTGPVDENEAFIDLYERGVPPKYLPKVRAFIYSKLTSQLYYAGAWATDAGEYLTHRTAVTGAAAIGSGERFAFTAMDCGKSAEEAIELTKLRDVNTGGIVNSYILPIY